MSALPRIAGSTREQIAREFDDLGSDAYIAEISEHLRDNNPEWLYMAAKCAGDVGDARRIMGGFCTSNPELLQMAHDFASEHDNYAGIMQGFALLYAALLEQSTAAGLSVHRESIKNRPGP